MISDAELQKMVDTTRLDGIDNCSNNDVRAMAAEILAARKRITALEAEVKETKSAEDYALGVELRFIEKILALEAALRAAESLQVALDERLPARRDGAESAGAVIRARSELRSAIEAARAEVKP